MEYAFDVQNMHKVYYESLDYNKKVISIHKKFGFKYDGIKRQHVFKKWEMNNLVLMSVLKKEF